MRDLRKCQSEALDWAKNKTGIALFMEMRLGKSLVFLRWMRTRPRVRGAGRALVVCPLSALDSWTVEARLEGLSVSVAHGARGKRLAAIAKDTDVVAVTWDSLRTTPEISARPWNAVCLDESSRMKNPKAQVCKAAMRLFRAPYRAVLDGLPDPEGPQDFVMQMLFVHGVFMQARSYWEWRNRWMRPSPWGGWWTPPNTVIKTAAYVREHAFVMTRKEANLGCKKVYKQIHVDLPRNAQSSLQSLRKTMEISDNLAKNWLQVGAWEQAIAAGVHEDVPHTVKQDAIKTLLLKSDLRNKQVVIYCRFTKEVRKCLASVKECKITTDSIIGSTPKEKRSNIIRLFQKGKIRILVAQAKCLTEAVDLSCASAAIYVSNWWSVRVRAQTEDRLVAVNRPDPPLIVDIIARKSCDEDVAIALLEKGVTARAFQKHVKSCLMQKYKRYG